MDPDKALEELMGTVTCIEEGDEAIEDHAGSEAEYEALVTAQLELACELAEQVAALDGWLKSGGFLPAAWKGAKRS